jgi:hypothetical protein
MRSQQSKLQQMQLAVTDIHMVQVDTNTNSQELSTKI